MAIRYLDKTYGATGHGNHIQMIAIGSIGFNMRAILVGDNQFDLYCSLEDALNSMERPEVESGSYFVYDEEGNKYKFQLNTLNDAHVGSFELALISSEKFDELVGIYRDWIKLNDLNGLPEPSSNLFNDLERRWGLQKS